MGRDLETPVWLRYSRSPSPCHGTRQWRVMVCRADDGLRASALRTSGPRRAGYRDPAFASVGRCIARRYPSRHARRRARVRAAEIGRDWYRAIVVLYVYITVGADTINNKINKL